MSTGHERLNEENPGAQAHNELHVNNGESGENQNASMTGMNDSSSSSGNNSDTNGSGNSGNSGTSGTISSWKLSVRTLTGQNIPVEIEQPDTALILDIKNKLETQMNVPVSFMRLIFAGRELVDGNKVTSYGIKEGDAVHLVLRQNQPAPRPSSDDPNAARGDYQALPIPVVIPDPNNHNVPDAWQLGRAVKMFSIVDGIFLLLWAFSYWYFTFAVVLAICGFYGATHYRLSYVCLYVVYLLLSIGFRIFWMTTSQGFFLTLVLVLGVLIEFYILNITLKFIKVIRRLTPADRAELTALNAPAFGF